MYEQPKQCDRCGKALPAQDLFPDEFFTGNFCQDCLTIVNNLHCTVCKKKLSRHETYEVGGSTLCMDCMNELYPNGFSYEGMR